MTSLYWECPQKDCFFSQKLAHVPGLLSRLRFYLFVDGFLQIHQLLKPVEFYLQLSSVQGTRV